MRLKALLILFPLVFVLFSCASDSSAPSSGVQLVHESRLDAEGHVANPNTVIMLDLEADTDHVGDTGELGFDEIPLEVSRDRTYQLCIDNEEGADHTMEVVDASGNTLATASVSTGCSEVLLATGNYIVRLRHGAAGTPNLDADRVFLAHVRPYPERVSSSDDSAVLQSGIVIHTETLNSHMWKVCSNDPTHRILNQTDVEDPPGAGEVFLYADNIYAGSTGHIFPRCRFTVTGNRDVEFFPRAIRNGPNTTTEVESVKEQTVYGDSKYLLKLWTPGWTRYWANGQVENKWEQSLLNDKEGWFALHLGPGTSADQPVYLIRGSVDSIDRLGYGAQHNTGSTSIYPWLTLAPYTAAQITYRNPSSAPSKTFDLINDTAAPKEFRTRIAGHWESVRGWRLKNDIDDNLTFIRLQASVGHCRGCNLKGAELSLNLNDFDFSHADLTGAKFMGSSLDRAIFERSILDNADMDMTTLNCAQLTNCDLSTVRLGSDLLDKAGTCDIDLSGSIVSPKTITWFLVSDLLLTRVKLDQTVFSGFPSDFFQFYPSNFNGVQMQGAKFVDVSPAGSLLNLSGSTWKDSQIKGIDLSTVNLSGAVFDGAVARDANFSKSTVNQAAFRGAVLSLADFSGADLNSAIFDGASARGAKFNYANLTQTSFQGTTLDGVNSTTEYSLGANFSGAIIDRSDFSFAPLGKVDFSHATFSAPILTGALLDGAKFQGSWLVNADLTTAQSFRGADFSHAYLMNADLSAADLSPALDTITTSSLQNAYLQGADLGNTDLKGSSLSQAILSFTSGQMTAPRPRWDPLTKSIVVDQHWPVSYEISAHSALTDGSTTCPNGYPGPCDTVEKWKYVPPPDGGGIDPDL